MATMNDAKEERILEHARRYADECARIEAIVTAGMDEMGRWYWQQEFRRLGLEALTSLADARPLGEAELYSFARQARMTVEGEMETAHRTIAAMYQLVHSESWWERLQTWWHNVCGT